MVEYTHNINNIFSCLADQTRRDILKRVGQQELNISQIAYEYDMSIAAVSKHIQILEKAGLVSKRHNGKERLVSFTENSLSEVQDYLLDLPTKQLTDTNQVF